ncbi:hypothetical protein HAX54_024693 [Datura stramonium]|uniref:Uncharacterized protein n=1 Tax=Datura stramonium TaxID=4076 RepID=A0ABS8RK70_DATST|nr:hypothetical protein [Datura stramonium]
MLSRLKQLVLCGTINSLALSPKTSKCAKLEMLALYQNNLRYEEIPVEIGKLKFLKRLYLYRNGLNGTIPSVIGNLSSAIEIDFSENYLIGEIPAELSQIKGLKLLYLFRTSSKNLTELVQLQLFQNSLSDIPQGLRIYMPTFELVDLSNNYLTGRIPPYICRNSNLIWHKSFSNNLYGDIPPSVIYCDSLLQLRLNSNWLRGNFPSDLCKLRNLSALELGPEHIPVV